MADIIFYNNNKRCDNFFYCLLTVYRIRYKLIMVEMWLF